jgi:carboxymethylenebutenolidase
VLAVVGARTHNASQSYDDRDRRYVLGTHLTLTSADKFQLGAYRADPQGKPKGAIVVVQEIFGVNTHIRSVCDRFAADGYVAIAPALFDRQQRDFQCGYTPDEVTNARKFIANPDWALMAKDTQAAIDAVKSVGPLGVVGFCMGGTIAFLAATRLDGVKAAVCYYGGKIVAFADEKPRCPTEMHFGALDQGIPLSDVETIKAKRPDCEIFIYPDAGHGFHCDERASYHAPSAAQAWERTTAFFAKHLR